MVVLFDLFKFEDLNINSEILFETPIKFVGRTALSDEIRITFFTLFLIEASAINFVEITLFSRPEILFSSTMGTCL